MMDLIGEFEPRVVSLGAVYLYYQVLERHCLHSCLLEID